MYLKFYGLKEEPFHITLDPEFFYPSPSHSEALALMSRGVAQRKGFVVLTGGVGVGKSIIARTFSEHCRQQQIKVIDVPYSRVTFGALMKMIYKELGLERLPGGTAEQIHGFYQYLVDEHGQGRNVVLMIDEAQNMSINMLEDLIKLSDLEDVDGKLLQIILIGQIELEKKLNLHELRQIQQRIAVRIRVAELTPDESLSYIRHRLTRAGMLDRETTIFTPDALRLIVKHSLGIPRKINIICDNALSSGFGRGLKPVPVKVLRDVIADLDGKPAGISAKRVAAFAAVAVLFLVLAGLAIVRFMDFPGAMDSKRSASVTAPRQSGDRPVGLAPSAGMPTASDDTPHPQSVTIPAPDAQPPPSSSVIPSADPLKFQGDAPAGRESTVSTGNLLPLVQGTAQALPSEPALTSHGSNSIVSDVPQPVADGTSSGKVSQISEEKSLKTDKSIQEPKATLPASSKTVIGKTAGSADHAAVQNPDKQVRSQEPSGPTGASASKPGTAPEEDPHDPNKLMDWFMNKRGR